MKSPILQSLILAMFLVSAHVARAAHSHMDLDQVIESLKNRQLCTISVDIDTPEAALARTAQGIMVSEDGRITSYAAEDALKSDSQQRANVIRLSLMRGEGSSEEFGLKETALHLEFNQYSFAHGGVAITLDDSDELNLPAQLSIKNEEGQLSKRLVDFLRVLASGKKRLVVKKESELFMDHDLAGLEDRESSIEPHVGCGANAVRP